MFLSKLIFIFSLGLLACQANGAEDSEKAIVCYLGSWAAYRTGEGTYNIDNIDPFLCTHIVYSFFGINAEGNITILDPWLELPDGGGHGLIKQFNDLKLVNPNLKTLAAVGGWTQGSTNFSIVAADEKLRSNFATSVTDFLVKYNFSGCDIDWEYPMRRNDLNNDDRNNLNLLLEALKNAFEPYKFLLTIAVSAAKINANEIYNIPKMAELVDLINIMAYDMHVGSEALTGYNAPLYPPATFVSDVDVEYNDQAILDFWVSVAPASKLVLGVPFYGHTFILANASENKPYSPSAGPGPAGPYTQEAGTISYNELCIEWLTKNYTFVFDDVQGVPYAYLNTTWVSYDNPKSITLKAEMALKYNLAGVMFWSLENDDIHGNCGDGKSPLLQTINDVLKNTSD